MKKSEYFKSLDYHSRRDAKVALALFLQKNGWQIAGFRADESDMMTDYYSPASWGGVATLGDFTLAVDCRNAEAGHDIKKSNRINQPCEHCLETGEEPGSPWTLTNARLDPKAFHEYRDKREGNTGIRLLGDVVSPRYFTSSGAEKCTVCHGTGEQFVRNEEEVIGWYPAHLANPKSKGWHLEKKGDGIITSGQSIAKMYYGYWEGPNSTQVAAVQEACEEFLKELRIAMELDKPNPNPDAHTPTGSLNLEIVDYSEKAFAVFGDTKEVWPQLEAAHGRFNKYLTHPRTGQKTPGVIFGNRQRDKVEQLIASL